MRHALQQTAGGPSRSHLRELQAGQKKPPDSLPLRMRTDRPKPVRLLPLWRAKQILPDKKQRVLIYTLL
ncbi:hypothetical protein [Chitinilyticum litopenaei]|uniref:hypothetical protein n=1 Tax=Chitinilyticum litopenaei TaxID=1121276 RepID=UPI00048D1D7C|nr:hypothetical protein [Chitinilyticum litopenaei]